MLLTGRKSEFIVGKSNFTLILLILSDHYSFLKLILFSQNVFHRNIIWKTGVSLIICRWWLMCDSILCVKGVEIEERRAV